MLTLTKSYRNNQDTFVTTKRIADINDIPREFLEKIISLLSNAGFIQTQKGSHGGIKLIKDPSKITIAEVIREIDGPIAPVACVSKTKYQKAPIEKSKSLTFLLKRIRDIQNKILTQTTFADLV